MDRRRVPHHFQVGDKVWLYLDKRRFKNKAHHKVNPIRYGPYTILQKIRENVFKLDLLAHLGIHDVINVDLLKPYEESTLETSIPIHHPQNVIPDFQLPLLIDTIFDTKQRTMRHGSTTSYLVAKKGKLPHQARWISHHQML